MANRVYKSNFDPMKKTFKEIKNAIDKAVKDEEITKQGSIIAAQKFMKTLEQKYADYINNVTNKGIQTNAGMIYMDETEKGARVGIRGKDVLYQEYGTGTRGSRNPHPTHNQDGMYPYGSGEYVIHGGKRNNGDSAPRWYRLYRDYGAAIPKMKKNSWLTGKTAEKLANDFNDEPIGFNEYVWKHNGIITKGLPTGRFMYDTRKQYEDVDELSKNNVLKEAITQLFRTKVKENVNVIRDAGQSVAYIKVKQNLARDKDREFEEMRRKALGL